MIMGNPTQDVLETGLQIKLDYQFKNKALLRQALTHRSKMEEPNNERLEYLGDAVLELCMREIFFRQFPNANEGLLTKLTASMVQAIAVVDVAKDLNLGEYMIFGVGEANNNGKNNERILEDCMEAIIGAVYLDSAFPLFDCRDLIQALWGKYIPDNNKDINIEDYWDHKSLLMQYGQAHKYFQHPITYRFEVNGPSHNVTWTSIAYCDERALGAGQGPDKKIAAQEAAKEALQRMKLIDKGHISENGSSKEDNPWGYGWLLTQLCNSDKVEIKDFGKELVD